MSTSLVPKKNELEVIRDSRPSYLAEVPDEESKKGTEDLGRIVRPSFVKIVQGMSATELKKAFGEGAIVLTPDQLLLAAPDEKTPFIPIVFYTEYCKWAPIGLKGVETMIPERSFDPKSPVALKAQSPATWSEKHPKYPNEEKMNYRYQEHLNFILKLADPTFAAIPPVLISFARSNYQAGQTLGRLALRRKAPLYSQQFLLGTKEKPNQKGGGGTYRVYTIEDDSEQMWANESNYAITSMLHDEFFELIQSRRLQAEYDNEEHPDAVTEGVDTGKGF